MSNAVCTPRRAAPGANWPGLLLAFLCLFLFVGNAARASEAGVLEQTTVEPLEQA